MTLSKDNTSVNTIYDLCDNGHEIIECLKTLGASHHKLMPLISSLDACEHSKNLPRSAYSQLMAHKELMDLKDGYYACLELLLNEENLPGGSLYIANTKVGVPPSMYTNPRHLTLNFGRYPESKGYLEFLHLEINHSGVVLTHDKQLIIKASRNRELQLGNGQTINGEEIHTNGADNLSITPQSLTHHKMYYADQDDIGQQLHGLITTIKMKVMSGGFGPPLWQSDANYQFLEQPINILTGFQKYVIDPETNAEDIIRQMDSITQSYQLKALIDDHADQEIDSLKF